MTYNIISMNFQELATCDSQVLSCIEKACIRAGNICTSVISRSGLGGHNSVTLNISSYGTSPVWIDSSGLGPSPGFNSFFW